MPSTQGRQVMDTESTRKQFIYTWTSILFALLKRQIWSEAPPSHPRNVFFGPFLKGVGGDEKESKHISYGLNIKLEKRIKKTESKDT